MSGLRGRPVRCGYAAEAEALIAAFEALDSADVLAPVIDDLPENPGLCLDLGAGSGRDAAWLAARGHRVWAVEPVAAFRAAGRQRHRGHPITWVDDRLPNLTRLRGVGLRFDLILTIGVFHHLSPQAQQEGLTTALARLSPRGRMILSLRHGPAPAARPGHPVDTDALVASATAQGMRIRRLIRGAPSIQPGNRAVGVRRDWLCLSRE